MGSAYYSAGNPQLMVAAQPLAVALIPFFVLLSGAFYSQPTIGFPSYVWLKLLQRYLPVLFFGLLAIPIYLYFDHDMYRQALRLSSSYLMGIPTANWPTWFLVALMSAELIYYFLSRHSFSKQQSIALALSLYTIGYLLNHYKFFTGQWAFNLSMFWYIGTVPLFLACMVMGNAFKKDILNISRWPWQKTVAITIVSFIVLMVASNLNNEFPADSNQGMLKYIRNDMVKIFIGQYGNGFYFLLSAVAGIIFCLMMSKLLPKHNLIKLIGAHSLILFCLNGVFHHTFNKIFVKLAPIPDGAIAIGLVYSMIIGILSILACLPVAMALQALLPQLVGKPMAKGPLLPALYRGKS